MSIEKVLQAYKGKHVEMLTVCEIILEHALRHNTPIQTFRSDFTDDRLNALTIRIHGAFVNHLGIDKAAELRVATQKVEAMQKDALGELALFRVQLQEDFRYDKVRLNLILTSLGYLLFHKKAKKGYQDILIQFLFQFKENMTPELITEITEKGVMESFITSITDKADALRDLNIIQEKLKGSKKELTQAGQIEFNEIYAAVIKIAKIAAKYYKGDKAVSELFSYTKVLRNLTSGN